MKLFVPLLKIKFDGCVYLKVLYILPYDWGAMPQYTAEIANSVAQYSEVIVMGSEDINEKYFSEQVKLIKVFNSFNFSMNKLQNLFTIKTLKSFLSFKRIKMIEEIKPDIIHLTTPLIPPLALYLSIYRFDRKYPIVYTKHGIFSNSGLKEKILEEYILGFFERILKIKKIIVHTKKDKDALVSRKQLNENYVCIIPHGVYSFFKNYGKKYNTEKNSILFFGNIREYKGLRYLIQAIPIIQTKILDLKVIIAGEGDISEYSSYIAKEGDIFEIHNEFISDEKVSELFQRSEVVVMPYTKMSGQSGILNVAIAYSKPIVASDVGGIYEVVENGINGYLVPPKDYKLLAARVLNILEDNNLRSKMEINMSNRAKELSWDNISKEHVLLYSSLS